MTSLAYYATLQQVRDEIAVNDPNVNYDDSKATRALLDATARIDEELPDKRFLPRVSTAYHHAFADVDGAELILSQPLLEATSVVNGDGSTVSSSSYTLLPRSGPPYTSIRLKPGHVWLSGVDGDPDEAISVTGIWVSGRPHSGAWYGSGDTVVDDPLSAGATQITVDDADGLDEFRRSPRFSPGMLARLQTGGTTEYVEVLGVDTEDNLLYVRRGARGTTPVEHAADTAIAVWQVDVNIAKACSRLAAYYYKRLGHFADAEFNPQSGMYSRLPKDLPHDVQGILDLFRVQPPTKIRFFDV